MAHPNIALVKYWGKRDAELNLPAAGSLSITLDTLHTRTRVSRRDDEADRVVLNGGEDPAQTRRVSRFLDRLRALAKVPGALEVETENNFPTAAGLASSASGFAALTVAADAVLELDLDPASLSRYARMGSGSAARSLFGGFVEMHAGRQPDGGDAVAEPLLGPRDWPLDVVVAITSRQTKAAGSTDAMERSRQTAPFYAAWVTSTEDDLAAARAAVRARDFERLADVAEHSCLKMHATMLATRPPLLYWNPATLAAIQAVRALRADGTPVFFTVDAGPQVKAICLPEASDRVREALETISGVEETVVVGLGEGAQLISP